MTNLALLRRLNYRRITLTDDDRGEEVGVLLRSGEVRFVRWMGFMERREARTAADARPVRLADIAAVGRDEGANRTWRDLSPDEFVHGCLTAEGAWAVYDADVAIVGPRMGKGMGDCAASWRST